MRRRALLASVGATLGALAGCPGRTTPERTPPVTPAPVPTDDDWVTPPTASPTPAPVFQFPSSLGCPLLPRGADAYVCSPRAYPGDVGLFPDRSPFVLGPVRRPDDELSFTLRNRSATPFETRTGRWLLARNDADGWNVLVAGRSDTRLTVGADEAVTWTLGLGTEEGAPRRTVTEEDGTREQAGTGSEAVNGTGGGVVDGTDGDTANGTSADTATAAPAGRSVRRAVTFDTVEGRYSFGVHGFHERGRLVALQAPFVLDVRGAERSR